MSQSKKGSLLEAFINVAIGYYDPRLPYRGQDE